MQLSTRDSEPDVGTYMRDVAKTRPLSREREAELAARIRGGDVEARNELIQANLRFVVDVAKHYQHRGLSLSDLIGVGNMGLVTAAERFDGEKGFKFISYAVWWVRQAILQALVDYSRTVRVPLNRMLLLRDIRKAQQRLHAGQEREPSVEEIALELAIPADAVAETLNCARSTLSLDEALNDDGDDFLLDSIADPSEVLPDTYLLRESVSEQIANMLAGLEEREAQVIRLYFGLEDGEEYSLEKIGKGLGVTRERVRQLREKALGKLRHASRAAEVRELAGEFAPSSAKKVCRRPEGRV